MFKNLYFLHLDLQNSKCVSIIEIGLIFGFGIWDMTRSIQDMQSLMTVRKSIFDLMRRQFSQFQLTLAYILKKSPNDLELMEEYTLARKIIPTSCKDKKNKYTTI